MAEHKKERGQVLVLMVVGLVVLLGFTALAVDGGMLYSDRRYDQNAADASTLAAAGAAARVLENNNIYYENFKCDSTVNPVKSAALIAGQNRASSNLFTLDTDLADNHGIIVSCRIEDKGSYKDKYLDIKAMITSETNTAFAHLLFGGKLISTVTSVSRVRPRTTETFGYAVVSTSDTCDNTSGIEFDGTNDIKIYNAGIFSNSCLTRNGSADISVIDSDSGVRYRDDYDANGGSGSISPSPASAAHPLPPIDIPTPDCSGLDDFGDHSGGGTLTPGIYDRIRTTNGDDLVLQPGLYCIDGGLVANGGTISGTDVTLYFTGGNFDIGGGVRVNISSPQVEPAPNHSIKGVLIYLAKGNTGEADMRGSSDSSYLGTVYVPDGVIDVGGNSSSIDEINCQLIGHGVKIHGDVEIRVRFQSPQNYSDPSLISLQD